MGANVKYASDPFWGEKAASYAFTVDKYLSGNNINSLNDYNYNQLGIYSAFYIHCPHHNHIFHYLLQLP